MHSIHSFQVEGLAGETIDFSQFKGKKIIVVNVASECGFTPQYQQLQSLYEEFQDRLAIVGFPCNDFGGQESGNAETIMTFCTRNYGVTFPIAAKVAIRPPNTAPIFAWLTDKAKNGVIDGEIRWNFFKFLLNEDGELFKMLPSAVSPMDEIVLSWLNVD